MNWSWGEWSEKTNETGGDATIIYKMFLYEISFKKV
jgi:hypothetical protein